MLSILYTLALILIVWFINRWRSSVSDKLIRTVPSNKWHTLLRFGYILTLKNTIRTIAHYNKQYGSNSIFWMGPYPIYTTHDPQTIKDVLTSKNCVNKPLEMYDGLHRLSAPGLVTESDPVWSQHRRLINKAFSNKNLISFLPAFNVEIDKFLNDLKASVGRGEDLDMLVKLRILTMKISTRTTLKRDIDLTKFNATSMAMHFEHILQLLAFYIIYPFLNKNWFRKLFEPHVFQNAKEAITMLQKFCDESLNIARENDTADKSFLVNEYGVLDCCINITEEKEFSEEEIRGVLMQFYVAAFETISTTLYLALLLLAMHPEHQDRAYEEVHNILGDSDTELTVTQLDDMIYLEMILNETMRVLPIVPLVCRKVANEEVKLSNGVTLPTGQIVAIDIFHLHRSKAIWGPEAESFNPANFLPSNVAARHPYSFVPFTKGQRFCIGWRYATLLFKMSLAKLINSFKLSTDFQFKDLRFENHITLKLVEEPRLKLERRNAKN